MAFRITKSWKEELKGYCACFSNPKSPIGLTHETRPTCETCPARALRELLQGKNPPTQTALITAMLKTGNFKRKQFIGALTDLFSCNPNSAATRVATILRPFRAEGSEFKIIQGEDGRYFISKRNRTNY